MTEQARDQARKVDPITVEIIRNGLLAVTEEMKSNLMRTAYNLIIYEALDFTVGLFTATGETISIGLGLPMFIRGMSETVKAKIAKFQGDIHPGDILVTNDAYVTGSHLNHFTFTLPVFHEGKLVAFCCCMAHWIDVGGVAGGATTDIYSEGLQVPLMKYRKAGVVNQDLVDIIAMNVRLPERAREKRGTRRKGRSQVPPFPKPRLLQVGALRTGIDVLERFQNLRAAVLLHLRQVDGERRMALLAHLDLAARTIDHDFPQRLDHFVGVG